MPTESEPSEFKELFETLCNHVTLFFLQYVTPKLRTAITRLIQSLIVQVCESTNRLAQVCGGAPSGKLWHDKKPAEMAILDWAEVSIMTVDTGAIENERVSTAKACLNDKMRYSPNSAN